MLLMLLLLQQVFQKLLLIQHFGITGSTLAIIAFNYFSSTIDSYTFKIDEAGFSLTQNFAASLKEQLILNLSFGSNQYNKKLQCQRLNYQQSRPIST
ncbi:MAG: hypothetical protein MZV63_03130 [Marinilabiliales bacterium]|nr:hypothetical protein [Marinilabiliales bacterium]